jgi:hypothetical protein
MATLTSVIICGTNLLDQNEPLYTDLIACSDLVSYSAQVYQINLVPTFENEVVSSPNSTKFGMSTHGFSGELWFKVIDRAAANANFFDNFPFVRPLKMNYIYLYSTTYKEYLGKLAASGKAVQIVPEGLSSDLFSGGLTKTFKLKFTNYGTPSA